MYTRRHVETGQEEGDRSADPVRELQPQIAAIILLVILAFGAIVRLRLLELPLDRDEGVTTGRTTGSAVAVM